MEILNRILSMFLFVMIISSSMLNAQNNIAKAFESSYGYEAEGEYSKAIEAIKVVYDESSYEINARLGWLNYMSGMFTESITYYGKAIDLKPYAIESRFGISYPASAIGNWTQVENQYLKILEIDPMNTYANYRQGLILYNRKDFETAFIHFEKVVNLYPFDFDASLMLGWTNFQLGKLREAEVLFNKALFIDPDNESALEGLEAIK